MQTCWNCGFEVAGSICPNCGNRLAAPMVGATAAAEATAAAAAPAPIIDHPAPLAPVQGLQSQVHDLGQGKITNRAHFIQGATDETMIWEDSPSLALMFWPLVFRLFWIAVICVLAVVIKEFDARPYAAGLILLLVLRFAWRAARLLTTKYRLTSQRLIVDVGVFSRVSVPYELHQLGDALVVSTLLLRMCGRATLVVQKPYVRLRGIRNAAAIRDLIRNAGQREAHRVDMIRWR
jgi:hypothetical protein